MTPAPAPPAELLGPPIAHRGLHDRASGRIENSRAAFAAAVEAGYGVELDVQLSADGEAMVFHDAALDRLTAERGPLRERSAAELARIELRDGGETIPRLAEALEIVAGRVALLVEIKDQGGGMSEAGVGPLERRVAELLEAYEGPVAVMSFNPASVAEMARLAPMLPRGLTACPAEMYGDIPADSAAREALARVADAERVGAGFVSYEWRALPTPRTEELKTRGLAILSWTIRAAEDAEAAFARSDNITFEGFAPPAR